MTFFQKISWKPHTLMPIFGQKTSILLKLQYFMVIKVTRMPFLFRFFTKKSLLSWKYFIKNTYILKKTHCSHAHISQKTSILSKTQCSHVLFFFEIFHEKLLLSCTWLVKKRQFCQNYTLFWAKKVIGCPFFLFLTKKFLLLCQYFVKKTSILKKEIALISTFCQKKRPLS